MKFRLSSFSTITLETVNSLNLHTSFISLTIFSAFFKVSFFIVLSFFAMYSTANLAIPFFSLLLAIIARIFHLIIPYQLRRCKLRQRSLLEIRQDCGSNLCGDLQLASYRLFLVVVYISHKPFSSQMHQWGGQNI